MWIELESVWYLFPNVIPEERIILLNYSGDMLQLYVYNIFSLTLKSSFKFRVFIVFPHLEWEKPKGMFYFRLCYEWLIGFFNIILKKRNNFFWFVHSFENAIFFFFCHRDFCEDALSATWKTKRNIESIHAWKIQSVHVAVWAEGHGRIN